MRQDCCNQFSRACSASACFKVLRSASAVDAVSDEASLRLVCFDMSSGACSASACFRVLCCASAADVISVEDCFGMSSGRTNGCCQRLLQMTVWAPCVLKLDGELQ